MCWSVMVPGHRCRSANRVDLIGGIKHLPMRLRPASRTPAPAP